MKLHIRSTAMMRVLAFTALFAAVWVCSSARAAPLDAALLSVPAGQSVPSAQSASSAQSAAGAPEERLAPLGPGDTVTIAVFGQPDMTTTAYVGDDGTVRVPLAGVVRVSGATPVQAAERIQRALKVGGYFVDPLVTVTLVNSRSERVSVLGEVGKPGTYAIDPSTTVFDLLAEAGGQTANAADTVYVRRHEADGRVVNYAVDLRGLSGTGAPPASQGPSPSQRLQGGDELYVPDAQHFYVYGEVNQPNMYKLEPGMTVIEAIARAGGVTPRGSARRIEIKRLGPDGKYVVSRGRPDELVQADDVIRVKESIF